MPLTVRLSGPEGNAFALMGLVKSLGVQLGLSPASMSAILADMKSKDYKHLVRVFADNFGCVVDIYNADGTLYTLVGDHAEGS